MRDIPCHHAINAVDHRGLAYEFVIESWPNPTCGGKVTERVKCLAVGEPDQQALCCDAFECSQSIGRVESEERTSACSR